MSGDVVVVGGGVIGIAVAYELAQSGAEVTVLERGGDLAWECSAGNAGMVTSTHALPLASPTALMQGLRWMWRRDSPFKLRPRARLLPWLARFAAASTPTRAERAGDLLVELTQRGLELHSALADSGLDTSLVRRGMVDAYETSGGVEFGRAEINARRALGLTGELLTTEQLLEAEPALSTSLAGGAFYPDEAHCDPLRFTQALGAAAAELGVRVRPRVEVLALEMSAGRITALQTTSGRITADKIVLAAGVWSAGLARDLGLYLPIEAGKGYHVDMDAGSKTPRLPVYMMESKVVATPLNERIRLSGTLELDGMDTRVDPVRVGAIVRAGERHFPAIRGALSRDVWRGLRPCAPDGLPLIGPVDGVENLVVATGHGMAGTTLAPITAKLVSEVLQGVPPSVELDLMRPDRFRRMLAGRTRTRNASAALLPAQ
ncbi:MAG: FAD-dependent oxidoreductase [Actinomycetia bacterium]|nr:FAD-dependent oxidoreductase [Actinomycetes bacterium]